jgi:hypothetical protein
LSFWVNRKLNERDSINGLNLTNNSFFELTGELKKFNSTAIDYAELGKTLQLMKPDENDRNDKKIVNLTIGDMTLSRRVYEAINAAAIAGFIHVKLRKKDTTEIVDYFIPSVCQTNGIYMKKHDMFKYFVSIADSQTGDYRKFHDNGQEIVYIPIIPTGKMYKHKGGNFTKEEMFDAIDEEIRDSEVVLITYCLDAALSGTVADWWPFGKFSKHSNVLFVLSHRK